jgi:poly-gamma-glutamate synthesis protein (capsule biosynthesis protein)
MNRPRSQPTIVVLSACLRTLRQCATAAGLLGLLPLAWAQTPAAATTDAPVLRLSFAGDIMLDDGPGKVVADGRDPLAPFASRLAQSDFAIGNLECPIAASGTALDNKIYTFRADPSVTRVLQGKFHALSVANNHSGDYGPAAFTETLQHLQAAGIRAFGGGANLRQAHAPLWIEKSGIRVAVLGYNEYKPRSFEAGPDWPGVAWSEDEQVLRDIRAARRAGADWVIPFMHWGWENEPEPVERQRQLARAMIDAGADLVVGGHPHVTQGAETYKGKPIIYSLGNFVFDGFDALPNRQGWLLNLTLGKDTLLDWHTLLAEMDDEGTPHPQPGAQTPCGQPGPWGAASAVGMCSNP